MLLTIINCACLSVFAFACQASDLNIVIYLFWKNSAKKLR